MDREKQKQAYCKSWDRKNKCKSIDGQKERSRSRRTVRVGIERISVKVDGQKEVEAGVVRVGIERKSVKEDGQKEVEVGVVRVEIGKVGAGVEVQIVQ